MNVIRAHHVALVTTNLARLREFYVDVLGFPVTGGFPRHDILFIDAGGISIELVGEGEPKGQGGSWDHLAWTVEDVDAACRELSALGVRFHIPPEDFPPGRPAMRIAFFKDPDGNVLEILQPLAKRR